MEPEFEYIDKNLFLVKITLIIKRNEYSVK